MECDNIHSNASSDAYVADGIHACVQKNDADMLLRSTVAEMLQNGESSSVEFKEDAVSIEDLAKELVALTNARGGTVLLGVSDDASVVGLTRVDDTTGVRRGYNKLQEWVMQCARDKIRPSLIPPEFEIISNYEPGKDVAAITVGPGIDVHARWHNNHATYYIRAGNTSREASNEELQRLFQRRGALRAELSPIVGAGLETFDRRRIEEYFGKIRGQEVPSEDEQLVHMLLNTEIMIHDAFSVPRPTLGGLLLFGENPQHFFPAGKIEGVVFAECERSFNVVRRITMRGPMVPLNGAHGMIDNGLVEQALSFVLNAAPPETIFEDDIRRREREIYPARVVREAIVNALVHRDYTLSASDIEIAIFPDRLEITSAGRLPNGVTSEAMRFGVRATRNELIKDTMRDYGYIESIGLGVPRQIIRGMREHNGTTPDLIAEETRFILRLHRERIMASDAIAAR